MTRSSPNSPPHKARFRTLQAVFFLGTLFLGFEQAGAVPKTDVVTLINGDVITGEIKELSRGKLRVKTDHMETIYIKWDKINRVESHYWFLVTLRDGRVFYGQMPGIDQERVLEVALGEKSQVFPMVSIVEIHPVRYEFWDKFDFSLAWGFNWTKASQVVQSNLDGSARYSGRIYNWGTSLSSIITDRGEGDVSRRYDLGLYLGRDISGRLNGQISTGLSRNDELGVRLRYTGGFNLGYFLIRNNHMDLLTQLGANLNREWAKENDPPSNNVEAHLGMSYTMFRYDSPKTDLSISAALYPNLSQKDRLRFEFGIVARQEIVKDLFIRLKYYESQDNKPPSGANATNDRGVVFSIEWSK